MSLTLMYSTKISVLPQCSEETFTDTHSLLRAGTGTVTEWKLTSPVGINTVLSLIFTQERGKIERFMSFMPTSPSLFLNTVTWSFSFSALNIRTVTAS